MPFSRSFRLVRLVFDFRAAAMRFCQCWILFAASSINAVRRTPLSHQLRTRAATATCTWQTVRSGFFFPQPLADPSQEQVAHRSENQVSFQPQPSSAFPLVETDLLLLILETPLHPPTRESHQQQSLHRGLFRGVAEEELDLLRLQGVASDYEVDPHPGQIVLIFDRDHGVLDFPHHGALLAVLNAIPQPLLIPQLRRVFQHVLHADRRPAAGDQSRRLATPSPPTSKRPFGHPRLADPTGKRRGDFSHEGLDATRYFPQELRFSAIYLVEGEPIEHHPVAAGTIVDLQGNLPFRAIDHLVRDACRPATFTVVRPAFRQEQVPVHQAVEIPSSVRQMNRDNTVLRLADGATPLPLHTWGLVALLHIAGLVDDADRVRTRVLTDYALLEEVPREILLPFVSAQELLQITRGNPGRQGDRLAAFLCQIRQLSLDVGGKMLSRVPSTKTIHESVEVLDQLRFQLSNLCGVHAKSSMMERNANRFAKFTSSCNINLAQ